MSVVETPVILLTDLTHVLVAGHVGSKAANVIGNTQAPDHLDVVLHVVLPAQPAAMTRIQVDGSMWVGFSQCFHSIADTTRVRTLGCIIPTPRVVLVG